MRVFVLVQMENLDTLMTEMNISNEENEEIVFDEEIEENNNRFELCLVGKFMTEKNINVRATKTKLADLWRPAMGISIKSMKPGIFLFQFYHMNDMKWMLNNGPWSFDGAMLVTNGIQVGEDPLMVPLNDIDFWIQIHHLPSGFMVDSVGKQLGNFFGKFLEYDQSNNSSIWREYMRIRIKVNVRFPLKRKKKISRKNKSDFIVNCKYEKLGDFCFLCGLISHTERFCRKKLEEEASTTEREWGSWLRAPARRGSNQEQSKWLRDERVEAWGGKSGEDKNQAFQNRGFQHENNPRQNSMEELSRKSKIVGKSIQGGSDSMSREGIILVHGSEGTAHEELDGLELEERKRKRMDPKVCEDTEKVTDTINLDSMLSEPDCIETSNTFLAPLVQQASRDQ